MPPNAPRANPPGAAGCGWSISRTRAASPRAFSLDTNSFDTRFPTSSSSQYAVAPGIAGAGGRVARVAEVARGRLQIFVRMSFALRGASCGDDAHLTLSIGDHHDDQLTPVAGFADDDPPRLIRRVIGVRIRPRQRVQDGLPRLIKADAVFGPVFAILAQVPRWLLHSADRSQGRFTRTYLDKPEIRGA